MSRSSLKGPFFNNNLIVKKKNLIIIPENINNIYSIYNGKNSVKLKITENMVGHKFGEFINTRIRHIYKKKKK